MFNGGFLFFGPPRPGSRARAGERTIVYFYPVTLRQQTICINFAANFGDDSPAIAAGLPLPPPKGQLAKKGNNMIIASQKKKENIAEYLLYMWQIEDLIRAYGLDIDRIQQQIIDPYDISPEQKKAMREWYESLIDMMHAEGVEQKGHLQLNKNVLIDLTDLHLRLLKSPREPFYGAAFFKTLPYIVELRAKSGDEKAGELETCFNALYGVLLLRLQKKEIKPDTLKAIQQISSFLSLLAEKYKQDKAGELKLEND